jgi:hypothetical protein
VLDYKIKELKLQIAPRENEITVMQRQIEDMDLELEQYHKSNLALNLMIGPLPFVPPPPLATHSHPPFLPSSFPPSPLQVNSNSSSKVFAKSCSHRQLVWKSTRSFLNASCVICKRCGLSVTTTPP